MAKSKPTRAKLTWDEIREIEAACKEGILVGRPKREDVTKLIKHIRFIEHELEQMRKDEEDRLLARMLDKEENGTT